MPPTSPLPRPGPRPVAPPTHHIPPVNPVLTRTAVTTVRTTTTAAHPHPTVYQPWKELQTAAAARLKIELSDALRALEQAMLQAGVILDTTSAYAAEAAGQLEAAAWAAWHKYMDAADKTRTDILKAAVGGYDSAIESAHNAYVTALDDAEKTFKSMMNDAARAKNDAGQIPA